MFQIGDRVVLNTDHPDRNRYLLAGHTGTICDQDGDGRPGVRWDVFSGGHDCSGHCEDGYGWYVNETQMEMMPAEEEDNVEIEDDAFSHIIYGGS